MTEKRFNIKPSAIVDDVTVIIDSEKQYTFPTLDSTLNYMFCKVMNELADENEQLKQRNDRQYNQLKQLWELIEDEDYNTLRSMLNQREADEKLLQKEWGTYSD